MVHGAWVHGCTGDGAECAPWTSVAGRLEDLEIWQLANELKKELYALTADGKAARGSLFEVSDQLLDGVERQYWTAEAIRRPRVLIKRTTAGVTRFIDYLRNNPDP
jgi:hypothetical protein